MDEPGEADMRIYLAARYGRRLELCGYAEQLRALGHEVKATWLDGSHQISDCGAPIGDKGELLVEGDAGGDSEEAAALRSRFAREDVREVLEADWLISFTEPPRSNASRGGRHVEMGIAIAARRFLNHLRATRRLIVCGPRENVFHWLPEIEHFPTWDACLEALATRTLWCDNG